MQALIVNYDQVSTQIAQLNKNEINKIEEFKNKGNLIGMYVGDKKIDCQIERSVDFIIQSNGVLSFKEGYDYFDYEPLSIDEINQILYSLRGDFKVVIDSKDGFSKSCSLYDIKNLESIKKQIEKNFSDLVSVSEENDQLFIYSKKSNIDRVVDRLCGIKRLNINNVYVLTDKYEESKINCSVNNIYVLNDSDYPIENKEIFYVDDILECMNDLLEERSFLFTKCE